MNHAARMARARERMVELGVDALLLSVGPDLPYLTGYEAMPLERLTMLVVRPTGDPVLLIPRLEAPRVLERPEVFSVESWDETEDPVARVAALIRGDRSVAIGDHTWSRFLLALQAALPDARFRPAGVITGPLRARKDPSEVDALAAAARAVDDVARTLRLCRYAGRTERDVQRELIELMLDAGHERANFAIVAAGPNAASPHHEAGDRRIADGDVVLCDFGGVLDGYCSDITRMYVVGEPSSEVRDAYDALAAAQEAAVAAATVGTTCGDVDAVARQALAEASLGAYFIHRTGHGIGVEAHEDPYLVAGNAEPLAAGHCFSIEPGVYVAGRFGLRLEDIVVATEDGPRRLNEAPRDLAPVD
ncbi:MAG TPA: Xaa-Pro peptidase family protein [Acidimicrobiia bacterium]|nr:Xaa-Pro peptidase family protein [Acidimicrobiia bacterium]